MSELPTPIYIAGQGHGGSTPRTRLLGAHCLASPLLSDCVYLGGLGAILWP